MFLEYCIYNKILDNYDEEIKGVFDAIQSGQINGLALPIEILKRYREFIPEDIKLSTGIDYPLGLSSQKVKEFAVLNAIKSGANAIDFIPNQYNLKYRFKELIKELETVVNICKDNNTEFRVFLDYNYISSLETIARLYSNCGIEIALPTIGYHHDDFYDNIIHAKNIEEKTNLKIIFNGYVWTKDQLEFVKSTQVYGIRLYNKTLWCS
jgi:hypothetical protein